ncbi:MAG: hypothetical protein ABH956_02965 [Candidatus Nealsonbacteria bacterium]
MTELISVIYYLGKAKIKPDLQGEGKVLGKLGLGGGEGELEEVRPLFKREEKFL